MMHHTYTSSILSQRTYLSYNDYSYYPNARCPSSCCTCCCSYTVNLSNFVVPINPSLLYGLRQSALIQWAPTRRVVVGSGDRYQCRSSVYDVGRVCCRETRCGKGDRVGRVLDCKEKCCVEKKRVDVNKISRGRLGRRSYGCSALGDAEAMLSLLTEDTVEECWDVRERKRSLAKERKVVEEQNVVGEKAKVRKENADCGRSGRHWEKPRVDMNRVVRYRQEGHERREDMEGVSKEEERRSRRRESSSSYYSLSDTGGFESDTETEVEVKDDRFEEESSISHGKDSRKGGGIVIRKETRNESKMETDERDQQSQSSKHEELRVASSAEWDWRKKSEKKLAEESVETRNDSVQRLSKMSLARESNSSKASSSRKKFDYEEENSTSVIRTDEQSYSKSSTRNEQLRQTTSNSAADRSTRRMFDEREEGAVVTANSVQETGCAYCKACGGSMQENKTQVDFQKNAETSRIQDDTRVTSAVQSGFESNIRKQGEKNKTQADFQRHAEVSRIRDDAVLRSDVQSQSESSLKGQERKSTSLQTSAQINTARKSEQYSDRVDSHDSYVESVLRSRQQSESRLKNMEENLASVTSKQEVKELKGDSSAKVMKEFESSKVEQTGLNASQVHSTNVEINRQSAGKQRIYDEQIYSTSKVKSVEEVMERRKLIDETVIKSTHRTEVQGPVLQGGSTKSSSGKATTTQPSVTFISQSGTQQVNEGEVKSDLQISAVSPSYQFIEGRSNYGESSTGIIGSDSGRIASSSIEIVGSESESFGESSSEDALGSAERMEESSIQVVDEFVEKMKHQSSTSDTRMEKTSSELDLKHKDEKNLLKGSTQSEAEKTRLRKQSSRRSSGGSETRESDRAEESSIQVVGEFVGKMKHRVSTSETRMEKTSLQVDSKNQDKKNVLKESSQSESEKTRLRKQSSRRSSGGSGTKGPSDEMWDVKDHFPQEPSEVELSEGPSSENAIARRTGKSLWSIVAGILRLRWGPRSETQTSPTKSGGQSSSPESGGGETWFSGNEQDEANSDGLKAEQTSMQQEGASSDQPIIRRNASKKGDLEGGASSSSSVLRTGSLSGGVSIGASIDLNVTPQISQPTPSPDSSLPPARRLRRSHAFEEIEEPGQDELVSNSTKEQSEQGVSASEISVSEVTESELKRRKLQRSKQVVQDRFDEWEDAYRRENDQRKVDQIFMREALVEAKKAADAWEVPIGAVLVQNGRVIARGYNLVEELRDSTAHAEMICIREASNVLRSWRLSETTLYVTLEPCPMCAGAILQARIGTLVWGAPNKLLGADGSWIRLFPEGLEGEERPEVADKPAAPVHPFHPKMKIRRGVLQEECADIMQQFFQLRRKKEKKSEEQAQPSCLPVAPHPSKLFHKMHDIFHIMLCL